MSGGSANVELDGADGAPLKLTERVTFGFEAPLAPEEALAFVRDVGRSLAADDLLDGLQVLPGDPTLVNATLPVATPLFGRRELPFRSALEATPRGARLLPRTVQTDGRGWAEVGGEAVVSPGEGGAGADTSRVDYVLDVTIFLDLPAADHWGTRALRRMIELTALSVLKRLVESLPPAVERAALGAQALAAEAGAAAGKDAGRGDGGP